MFATLDPTSRRLRFPRDRDVIVTDTVGFIRDLPPDLMVAFRATLEELEGADVFLHVVDASAPDLERRLAAVRSVLDEIGLTETPELLVFNQIDRLPPGDGAALAERHGAVAISALRGSGLHELLERGGRPALRGRTSSASHARGPRGARSRRGAHRMRRAKIAGTGFYVPERVVTNEELSTLMDTSDEWDPEALGHRRAPFRRRRRDAGGSRLSRFGARARGRRSRDR